jgi:periplasmic divalent cation tolerance protein
VIASPMRVVLCTCPPESAAEIARTVVGERLAACVNILPTVRSVYRWKGELCDDSESLLIIKTTADRLDELTRRLLACHPYDVPEVIALPIHEGEGNPDYLAWLAAETTPE